MRNLVLPLGLTLFFLLASFIPVGKRDFSVIKIVIDPGHGGKDPGTVGSYTKEKDIALQVALKVGEYVEKYIDDIEIIYTRKDDTFIGLEKRSEIANNHDADLFVSIHANSLPKRTPLTRKQRIKGTEVYVMGAQNTDRALEVAKRENSVILLEEDYEKKL